MNNKIDIFRKARKSLVFILLLLAFVITCRAQKTFYDSLSDAAIELTYQDVEYDPSYFTIDYPNGDIPSNKGVCTDVVIRAYRKLGIDLQKVVHEDMVKNFNLYPKIWGLTSTDKNIDHRRVPNLMTFFGRFGTSLPLTKNPIDYLPGDLVCWDLGSNVTHIGIIIDKKAPNGTIPLVVHNIGNGQEISNCLFSFKIIGHYRYKK